MKLKACWNCGISLKRGHDGDFCSEECHQEHIKKAKEYKLDVNKRIFKHVFNCACCGKEVVKYTHYRQDKTSNAYCSKFCRLEGQRETRKSVNFDIKPQDFPKELIRLITIELMVVDNEEDVITMFKLGREYFYSKMQYSKSLYSSNIAEFQNV